MRRGVVDEFGNWSRRAPSSSASGSAPPSLYRAAGRGLSSRFIAGYQSGDPLPSRRVYQFNHVRRAPCEARFWAGTTCSRCNAFTASSAAANAASTAGLGRLAVTDSRAAATKSRARSTWSRTRGLPRRRSNVTMCPLPGTAAKAIQPSAQGRALCVTAAPSHKPRVATCATVNARLVHIGHEALKSFHSAKSADASGPATNRKSDAGQHG